MNGMTYDERTDALAHALAHQYLGIVRMDLTDVDAYHAVMDRFVADVDILAKDYRMPYTLALADVRERYCSISSAADRARLEIA